MKTIVILCGGPPKKDRIRHLEIFNGKPCIYHVIQACTIDYNKICIVISKDNTQLISYVSTNFNYVKILESNDYRMITSFELAFNEDKNDTLIVAGDLWNLKKDNVIKFLNSNYKSAIYNIKIPWGKDIISKNNLLIRRGDIGCGLLLISNDHKKDFLSPNSISKAKEYFSIFNPNKQFDLNMGDHLWTWLVFTFFIDIISSKNKNNIIGNNEKGCIYIEDLVYLDND